jgi:hypothetical protein
MLYIFRRLYSWLADCDEELIEAVQSLLCDDDEDNFRVLVYLFDKSDMCMRILSHVLVDIVRYSRTAQIQSV